MSMGPVCLNCATTAGMSKLPEGVYVRGDRIWIRYTPIAGGAQIRESTGLTRDLPGAVKMAQALRAKRLKDAFEKRHFPDKADDCSLRQAVDAYVESVATKRSAPTIRKRLARALEFFGRHTLVSSITTNRIRAWERELGGETVRGGKKRSPSMVAEFLIYLRAAFSFAANAKLSFTDPMKGYELPALNNERDRVVSEDEIVRIVEASRAAGDYNLADAVLLARELGLRQQKIVDMDWARVDLKRKIYTVPPTPGGKPTPKRVPLSDLAIEVLEQRGPQGDGPVFVDETPQRISLRFGRLVRRLKIRDIRFHDLRHTTFTELERAGVGIRTIQAISGHKTMRMLFRYQTVNDEDLVNAANKRGKR